MRSKGFWRAIERALPGHDVYLVVAARRGVTDAWEVQIQAKRVSPVANAEDNEVVPESLASAISAMLRAGRGLNIDWGKAAEFGLHVLGEVARRRQRHG
jgi:hypothetical protein